MRVDRSTSSAVRGGRENFVSKEGELDSECPGNSFGGRLVFLNEEEGVSEPNDTLGEKEEVLGPEAQPLLPLSISLLLKCQRKGVRPFHVEQSGGPVSLAVREPQGALDIMEYPCKASPNWRPVEPAAETFD